MSVVAGKIRLSKRRKKEMAVRKRKDTKKASWQARWKSPDGKWKTKHFSNKASAAQFETQMRADVQQGDYTDPESAKIRISTVYENWKKSTGGLKPKTVDAYESLWRCLVNPEWGRKPIGAITRADVKAWSQAARSTTGKKVSSSRARQAVVLLNLLLGHAVDMELIKRNPLGNIKGLIPKLEEKKPQRALEMSELVKLASECGDYETMILLAGLTGIRWAEMVALTRNDFDFKEKTVSISKSTSEVNGNLYHVSTKSGKPRILPIPDLILNELREIVLSSGNDEPVFKSRKGMHLRRGNFARNVFKPAIKRAGLESIRFHDLRHTAITLLVSSGADILAISRVAGHSKPSTTLNVYAHELDSSTETIRLTIDKMVDESSCDRNATDGKLKSA
jgi:integrase